MLLVRNANPSIIKEKISEIIGCVTAQKNLNSSLFSGQAGVCLLLAMATKNQFCNVEKLENYFSDTIQNFTPTANGSLSNGITGFSFLCNFLVASEFIDQETSLELSGASDIYDGYIKAQLFTGNYDYLHGAIGALLYLAYHRFDNVACDTLNSFVEYVDEQYRQKKLIENWKYFTAENTLVEPIIGFAHGLSSLLFLFIIIYKRDINKEKSGKIMTNLINTIVSSENKNVKHSYFPNTMSGVSQDSRLAWCYGDLTICYTLYRAGKALKYDSLVDYAIEKLLHSTHRKTMAETMISEAGICHGSSGVAHIYNRLWFQTKKSLFKDAADFWIQKTLDFSVHNDGAAGFKTYNHITRTYEADHSFLEGITGIGLVLLSYLTGDFSWDHCLMLQDVNAKK